MRGFRLPVSRQDQFAIALPSGPPEGARLTEGDGGSLLMGFIAVCLAGLLLSAYAGFGAIGPRAVSSAIAP